MAVPNNLSLLFNTCFTSATILTIWKMAKVTPVPKGRDNQLVSTYRPISLLALLSKLIENIGHKRIVEHFSQNNLLDERQGVFRLDYLQLKPAHTSQMIYI